jgi:hypothetical protein
MADAESFDGSTEGMIPSTTLSDSFPAAFTRR